MGKGQPWRESLQKLNKEVDEALDSVSTSLEGMLTRAEPALNEVVTELEQVMVALDPVIADVGRTVDEVATDVQRDLRPEAEATLAELKSMRSKIDARLRDVIAANSSTEDDQRQGAAKGAADSLESLRRYLGDLPARLSSDDEQAD